MADVTTPTNTLAIRPDKMALLTERDRVVDRLDRLERAASGGMLGSGGGGSVSDTVWHSFAYAPATASVVGWKLTPIPVDASFVKTGSTTAFTRNADGSLTVRDAGVYQINTTCNVGGAAAAVLLQKGVSEAATDVSTFLTQPQQSAAGSGNLQAAWVGYLPAGQVIGVVTYAPAAYARQIYSFQIARIATGPKGDPGTAGPDTAWQSQAYGPNTAAATGFKLTPIPVDASFIKTGDAAAFARNADGSLTIRDAGIYVITACTIGAVLIQKGVSEAASDQSTFLAQANPVTTGAQATATFVGYLPAGQIVGVLTYTATSLARTVYNFQIARQATGPKGDTGAAGAPGPTGPSSAVVQPTAPSPRGDIVLWVDNDDVPPPASPIPIVSVLPSSPTDGTEVYFQTSAMALLGIVWRLKFRDTMGLTFYQWEFVGGSPLFDAIAANQASSNTAYVDLATVGPSVPLPLSGDYLVEWGADVQEYSTAQYMGIGVWNGSTWTQFGNPMYGQVNATGIAGVRASRSKATKLTGLVGGAANSLRARYATSAATSLAWGDRWMKVTPVRVN
jgi:hypothetical protein